jgi:hypothetical protein
MQTQQMIAQAQPIEHFERIRARWNSDPDLIDQAAHRQHL